MVVRGDWRRDALHACRLAIPPLVAVLLVIGVYRFVSFVNVYGSGQSVYECLGLARSLGRFQSLAAPFLVAAVWVAVYPVVVGLRWARHSHRRHRVRRSGTSAKRGPATTPSGKTGPGRGAPRKSPAA
jgi:hypothetical protein